MGRKVVKLKVVNPRKNAKVKQSDLKMLDHILCDLASGKVEEIAIVGLNKDGTMLRGWSPSRKTGNTLRMIGAIEVLKDDYLNSNIKDV